ncbi:hypothetical protein BGZ60DRAFT_533680 [Tricladium varicosporioides]|nr:hypothetical protein BGZ60DRAFT_533680 [Hymenoscyphus varicosporioides]
MSSQVTLRRFSLFLHLPFELQDIIWNFTLSEPRSISGEDCFREWWYSNIARFLSPVALHVCRRSRSLAKSTLKCTSIQIPGVPGWRIFYLNQTCDFFTVSKIDAQMNLKISRFIADPTLVNRVVISWGTSNEDSLKNMIHYLNHLSGLKEVVLTDRARLYLIYQRTFSRGNGRNVSTDESLLVRRIQQFFCDENRQISISGWFDGEANSKALSVFSDKTLGFLGPNF